MKKQRERTTSQEQDCSLLSTKKADFEDVWRLVGGLGRYPCWLMVFTWYLTIAVHLHQFVPIYYGTPPNFRCISTQPNISSSCSINKCGCSNCTYVFDYPGFTSAVSEWNLICKRGHFRALTQSMYNAGLLVGSLAFGIFSDKFGRKITIFLSTALMTAFGFGSAFANSLILFTIMRFGSGLCTAGCLITKFVYPIEICPLSYRTAIGVLCNIFVVIGALLLTLIAYLILDWRYLMLAVTIPGIPTLFLWRWFPESPRWLIAKGRLKEAQQVLESFATASGIEVNKEQLESLIHDIAKVSDRTENKDKAGLIDLVKTPKMRKRTIIMSYNWLINSIIFYGMVFNAKNLGGSFHLNVFIMFAVTMPGILTLWIIIKRCGRRVGYCGYMLLGGVACLLVLAVPQGSPNTVHPAVKGLAVFGVFCISATISLVYIYHSELSPTLLRNLSLGVGSMMSRVGGIIAPYFVFLNDFMPNLPLVVIGIIGFTAGFVALLLPETLYSPMPQTVSQVEEWPEDYGLPCRKRQTSCNEVTDESSKAHSEMEIVETTV